MCVVSSRAPMHNKNGTIFRAARRRHFLNDPSAPLGCGRCSSALCGKVWRNCSRSNKCGGGLANFWGVCTIHDTLQKGVNTGCNILWTGCIDYDIHTAQIYCRIWYRFWVRKAAHLPIQTCAVVIKRGPNFGAAFRHRIWCHFQNRVLFCY